MPSCGRPPGRSGNVYFRLVTAVTFLSTLIVVTCTFTRDAPTLPEDDEGLRLSVGSPATTEDDPEEGWTDSRPVHTAQDKFPLGSTLLEQAGGQKDLSVKKKKNLDAALNVGNKGRADLKKARVDSQKHTGDKHGPKSHGNRKVKMATTPVEKALQAAANAKLRAMSEQQKALMAAKKANEAAIKATEAPLTQAGKDIVKRARHTAAAAALQVQTARAAIGALMRAKQKASKAILNAAGGKYAKAGGGFAGQGGYFGAALRTAFHNGELNERLKHTNWKMKTLQEAEKKYFNKGKKKGEKKGLKEGEKIGEKKSLRKAVKKAKKELRAEKKTAEKAAVARKKAANKGALQEAAIEEASKVRREVAKEESKSALTKKMEELSEEQMIEGFDLLHHSRSHF